jgi:hypothetical protein
MRCENCESELKPTGYTFKFSPPAKPPYPNLIDGKYYLTYRCPNNNCENFDVDFIRDENEKPFRL